MGGNGDVVTIDPRTDERWAGLDGGSLFTHQRWLECIGDGYDLDIRAELLMQDGVPTAGVAYAHIDDLRGERIVSLPFVDYAAPPLQSLEHWKPLADRLLSFELPVSLKVPSSSPAAADGRFALRREWISHELKVPDNVEQFDSKLGTVLRGTRSAPGGTAPALGG